MRKKTKKHSSNLVFWYYHEGIKSNTLCFSSLLPTIPLSYLKSIIKTRRQTKKPSFASWLECISTKHLIYIKLSLGIKLTSLLSEKKYKKRRKNKGILKFHSWMESCQFIKTVHQMFIRTKFLANLSCRCLYKYYWLLDNMNDCIFHRYHIKDEGMFFMWLLIF